MTACVLGIGHYALQKHLEDTAGFLVDETTDALHTTPTGKTTDRGHGNAYRLEPRPIRHFISGEADIKWRMGLGTRLGDALDVVTKDLPVTLGTSLPRPLPLLPRPVMVNIVVLNCSTRIAFWLLDHSCRGSGPRLCHNRTEEYCSHFRYPSSSPLTLTVVSPSHIDSIDISRHRLRMYNTYIQ